MTTPSSFVSPRSSLSCTTALWHAGNELSWIEPPYLRQRLNKVSKDQHQQVKEQEQARQQKFNPDVWKVDELPNGGKEWGVSAETGKQGSIYGSKPITHFYMLFADMGRIESMEHLVPRKKSLNE
jgi:hypothetical protein